MSIKGGADLGLFAGFEEDEGKQRKEAQLAACHLRREDICSELER
ncbi:MAG: hypothetical protein AAF975_02190 [Spirochaetota bacterium]